MKKKLKGCPACVDNPGLERWEFGWRSCIACHPNPNKLFVQRSMPATFPKPKQQEADDKPLGIIVVLPR